MYWRKVVVASVAETNVQPCTRMRSVCSLLVWKPDGLEPGQQQQNHVNAAHTGRQESVQSAGGDGDDAHPAAFMTHADSRLSLTRISSIDSSRDHKIPRSSEYSEF